MKVTDEVSLANLVALHSNHPNYMDALDIKHRDEPLWKRREQIRLVLGIYTPIRFSNSNLQELFDNAVRNTNTYPHISTGTPLLIAYSKDEVSAHRDIQTPSKLGKYLTAVAHDKLTTSSINSLANNFLQMANISENELIITQNPKEIFGVYTSMSTRSCMSHKKSKWKLKYSFMLPSMDKKVQERIKEFQKDLGNTQLLHPSMFYGLSPDLALAYYRTGERIQARAIVHLNAQEYVRVYGNEFMHEMLKRAGYTKKETFSAITSAICICNTELHPFSSIVLAPYLDGSAPHNAFVDIKHGVLTTTYKKSAAFIGALRNYDVGGQKLDNTYYKLEDIYKDICSNCKKYHNRRATSPIIFTKDRKQGAELCADCVHTVIASLYKPRIGFCIRDKKLRLCVDTAKNFQYTHLFVTKKADASRDSDIREAFLRGYVQHATARMSEKELQNISSILNDLSSLGWNIGQHVHISSLNELDYDVDTESLIPAYEFNTAIFPDRTVKRTLHEVKAIYGSSCTHLLSKYGTNNVVKHLWEEYTGELKLVKVKSQLALESKCTLAIEGVNRTPGVLPRSMLTYAIATRTWYAIYDSGRYCEPLSSDVNPIELMKEHGKDIFEAKDIVYNFLPFSIRVSSDYVEKWRDEIAATNRILRIETPPEQIRIEPVIDLTQSAN